MSQKNNFSNFFYNQNTLETNNNFILGDGISFQYNNNTKEFLNLGKPLINLGTYNNFQIKNNGPIYINNITIKNNNKKYSSDEYSDLSFNNKNDINNNNLSKLFVRKKAGDTIDFKTKWKTEKCHYWEMHGECKFAENCAFAHGDEELKQKITNNNYKTKLCKQFFEEGICPYGSRCQFSHKKKSFDIQKNNNINNNKNIYYINYSEIISNLLLNEQITLKVIKRPRLIAFEQIVNCSQKEIEENRLKLYLDIIEIKNSNNNQIINKYL